MKAGNVSPYTPIYWIKEMQPEISGSSGFVIRF